VKKKSVAPVEPTLWIVGVGAILSWYSVLHISSRRFQVKVPSPTIEPTLKKKASVHWYFMCLRGFSDTEAYISVRGTRSSAPVEPTVRRCIA
jgi:hypothetical protein